MSRSTQYIGLTQAARDFIRDRGLRAVYSTHHETLAQRGTPQFNYDEGLCGEPVPYGIWEDPATGARFEEKLQDCPWSSGPMFFTHLVHDQGTVGSWTLKDRGCGEYADEAAGEYYV